MPRRAPDEDLARARPRLRPGDDSLPAGNGATGGSHSALGARFRRRCCSFGLAKSWGRRAGRH